MESIYSDDVLACIISQMSWIVLLLILVAGNSIFIYSDNFIYLIGVIFFINQVLLLLNMEKINREYNYEDFYNSLFKTYCYNEKIKINLTRVKKFYDRTLAKLEQRCDKNNFRWLLKYIGAISIFMAFYQKLKEIILDEYIVLLCIILAGCIALLYPVLVYDKTIKYKLYGIKKDVVSDFIEYKKEINSIKYISKRK